MVGQPPPPADDEHRLHEEFDDRDRHINEGPRREDEQELLPERGLVAVLNGIEPVAVEEVQPHHDADLGLIDQHEENDHRDGDAPLQCRIRAKRPDARPSGLIGIEVLVGDPHDLADGIELRHRIDEDREDRDRQRQRSGGRYCA